MIGVSDETDGARSQQGPMLPSHTSFFSLTASRLRSEDHHASSSSSSAAAAAAAAIVHGCQKTFFFHTIFILVMFLRLNAFYFPHVS